MEWKTVLTNTVSTALSVVVIGAMAIVWNGATNINNKVDEAIKKVEKNQRDQKLTIDILQETLNEFQDKLELVNLQASVGRREQLEIPTEVVEIPGIVMEMTVPPSDDDTDVEVTTVMGTLPNPTNVPSIPEATPVPSKSSNRIDFKERYDIRQQQIMDR